MGQGGVHGMAVILLGRPFTPAGLLSVTGWTVRYCVTLNLSPIITTGGVMLTGSYAADIA